MTKRSIFQDRQNKVVIAGSGAPQFAKGLAAKLDASLIKPTIQTYGTGAREVIFDKLPRGSAKVFIAQSIFGVGKVEAQTWELTTLINTVSAHIAKPEIYVVLPYNAYWRSDKADAGQLLIVGARQFVDTITSSTGDFKLLVVEPHYQQAQGLLRPDKKPWTIYLVDSMVETMKSKLEHSELPQVVVSPDEGGKKSAIRYSELLDKPLVVCTKSRSGIDNVEGVVLNGTVDNQRVLLVDDESITGGTLAKSAEVLKDSGASHVAAVITHCGLDKKSLEKVLKYVDQLYVSDTIELQAEVQEHPRVAVVSAVEPVAKRLTKDLRLTTSSALTKFVQARRNKPLDYSLIERIGHNFGGSTRRPPSR